MARYIRVLIALLLVAALAVPAFAQDATATPDPTTDAGATTMPEATAAPTQTAAEPAPSFVVTAPEVAASDSLAFVAFAHASVDAGALDLYIDGIGTTPVVSNLAFGEATDIVLVPAGPHTVSARAAGSAGDSEPLVSFSWDFTGNSTWVVSAVGLMETASLQLEPMTIIRTPTNGMARVRVANWVSDIEFLTVTGNADGNFADNLGWAGAQDVDVEPGSYQLQVTDGADATFGDASSFTFEADTVYTILLTGSTDAGPAVDLLVIELPQDETRIQFVNERADSVDIHMRPGDGLVVSVGAGETAEWVSVPSTAATFIAFAPGTGPTGQELASVATQLRPMRDVTIVFGADGTANIVSEDLTVPMDDAGDNNNQNQNTNNANTNTNDNSAGDTNTNDNDSGDDNGNDNEDGDDNGNDNS